jgi:hypothetical protein
MSKRELIDSSDRTNCARHLEAWPRGEYHFAPRTDFGAANGIERGDHHATQTTG